MKQDKGLTLIALIITMMLLLISAGIILFLTIRNNGFIDKVITDESSFNQTEVLEELKNLTATKYLEVYNEVSEDELANQYNTDILLQYFADDEEKIIDSNDEEGAANAVEVTDENSGYIYYSINIASLKRNVTKYGTGNWKTGDVYAIRREYTINDEGNKIYSDDLDVIYKDYLSNGGDITVIGNIDVNSPVK
jgi:flagellar basal body-associated protein FliL